MYARESYYYYLTDHRMLVWLQTDEVNYNILKDVSSSAKVSYLLVKYVLKFTN